MGKSSRAPKPRQLKRALDRIRQKEQISQSVAVGQRPVKLTPPIPEPSPWAAALAADRLRMEETWSEDYEPMSSGFVKKRIISRQSYASGFERIARENSEWAGLPVPIMGEEITMDPSYFGADKIDSINRIMNQEKFAKTDRMEKETENDPRITIRNAFWSPRLRATVYVYQELEKFHYILDQRVHRIDLDLRTLGCADAWSLETEQRALEALRNLVTHQKFRQYLMTGAFLEGSTRSGICYMIRRLRPTIAISKRNNELTILAALCLHPIAYYSNSWAGCMCPTDDVIAHLMLIRGDEKMFWKRANQHHPLRPEAGL